MKRWLLLGGVMVTAVLAFAFIACSDNKDKTASPTDTPAAEATTPMAAETGTPMAGGTPSAEIAPITMNEVAASGVTGTASITETATGGTEVTVTIDAGLDAGEHMSHIHHGTCATQPGEIHVNLSSVVAGADGSAPATTTTDPQPADGSAAPPYSHWLAREHYVAVHALDGTLVSCGDVVSEYAP